MRTHDDRDHRDQDARATMNKDLKAVIDSTPQWNQVGTLFIVSINKTCARARNPQRERLVCGVLLDRQDV
jgi:hypothetical protein